MVLPLLPQPFSLRCREVRIDPGWVTLLVETTTPTGAGPLYGRPSPRIQSRHTRVLA